MTRSRRIFAALLAASALIATGCLSAKMEVRIQEGGAGQIDYAVQVSPLLLELGAQAENMTPAQACDEIWASEEPDDLFPEDELPADIFETSNSAYGFNDEGICQAAFVLAWTSENSDAALAWLHSDSPYLTVEQTTDGWAFSLDTGQMADNLIPNPDEAVPEDQADMETADLALLQALTDATMTVSVELPGQVTEHNAHIIAGALHTWEFSLLEPPDDSYYLITSTSASAATPQDSTPQDTASDSGGDEATLADSQTQELAAPGGTTDPDTSTATTGPSDTTDDSGGLGWINVAYIMLAIAFGAIFGILWGQLRSKSDTPSKEA